MSSLVHLQKEIDDTVDIAIHALAAAKKHSILALPDVSKILKDIQDMCHEFKPSITDIKSLDAAASQIMLESVFAAFQKIVAAVSA